MTTSKGSEIEYIMYGNIMMQMQGQMMGIKTTQKLLPLITTDRRPKSLKSLIGWLLKLHPQSNIMIIFMSWKSSSMMRLNVQVGL